MREFQAFVIMIGLLPLPITGQKVDDSAMILRRSAVIRSANSTTLSNAVASALWAAKAPGGIAYVSHCGEEARYTFSQAGSTLEDALHAIVVANPQYTWAASKGVVNVYPINGDIALLSVNIPRFEIRKAYSLDYVVDQLLSVPEVQRRITKLNLTRGYVRLGMSDLSRPDRTRVVKEPRYSFRNVTLREALDNVARQHGTAVWEYRDSRCNGKTEFQVQFLVR